MLQYRVYNLPTYQDCIDKVNTLGELKFYYNIRYIQGYKVCIFNYRLATYQDFLDVDGFELRGLCFVFNTDNTLYKRYLLMKKFFNINQVEETQYNLIKDKPIYSVEYKEDGSIISFIKLPNQNIVAKSKMEFDNPQALLAMEFISDKPYYIDAISNLLDMDIVPIFEMVSPRNPVVLKYYDNNLILIKLRDNNTGNYIDMHTFEDVDLTSIPKSKKYVSDKPLSEIMDDVLESVNMEGVVIQFTDQQMVKQKSAWYCNLHHALEFRDREDYILNMVLDNEIDDFISKLHEEEVLVKKMCDDTEQKVYEFLTRFTGTIKYEVNRFNTEYNKDRKKYALDNRRMPYFPYIMLCLDDPEKSFNLGKELLKKECYLLSEARHFVKTGRLLKYPHI